MNSSTADVATPCIDYDTMSPLWTIPRTLMGGTRAVRAKARDLLPQNAAETETAYMDRLATSTLFNAFRKTVRSLSGEPFREAITVDNLDFEELLRFDENVDRHGRTLTGFARDCLNDMLVYGKCHFLVDSPDTRQLRAERNGRPLTLAEERSLAIRPYFVQVRPWQLIGWKGREGLVNGPDNLDRVRISESVTTWVSEWGQARQEQIRVLYSDRTDLWRIVKTDSGTGWQLIDTIPNRIGRIPLVTVYANRTGFMMAEPPLEDLADMNIKHWQSNSDQDAILHFARIYFLAFLGFREEEVQVVDIGQARGISNSNPEAHIDVIEHSGESIKAGYDDLQHKEDQMEGMGAEMLIPRPGNELATVRAIDKAEQVSDLQAMCRNLEAGLRQGYQYAGLYYGLKFEDLEGVICNIYQGFGMTEDKSKMLSELREDYKLGAITLRTYLTRRKQLGLYPDDFDVDEEMASIDTADPFAHEGVPTGAEAEAPPEGPLAEAAGG